MKRMSGAGNRSPKPKVGGVHHLQYLRQHRHVLGNNPRRRIDGGVRGLHRGDEFLIHSRNAWQRFNIRHKLLEGGVR